MFTVQERMQLRAELLDLAASDERISGAAITGSAASGNEDEWSDIDLAFGVTNAAELARVLSDFTSQMYERHQAVHHMDIRAGTWIYRVFFLASTLQVDLAFVPASDFRPLAPTFRLVSGVANDPLLFPLQPPKDIVDFGWLYAIHVRSCIARNKGWQAEYMISAMRDQALALACLRHHLPAVHGRGFDQLPSALTQSFEGAIVRSLDAAELWRAFGVAMDRFLEELEAADPALAVKLGDPLRRLTVRH